MPPSKSQLAWERAGHIGLGFVAGLLPLHVLVWLREWRQLPAASQREPQLFVGFLPDGSINHVGEQPRLPTDKTYWPATRVRDTLTDLRDKIIGFMVAWPFVFGAGILVGWRVWG